MFKKAVESGCEGLVCKSVTKVAVYQAGARGWLWIKYKRDYKSEMTDAVDLVVVGAFHGRGKKAGTYGALLLAAYNLEETCSKQSLNAERDSLTKTSRNFQKRWKKHKYPTDTPGPLNHRGRCLV